VVGSRLKLPAEAVRWMVALQAQDFSMARWAVGVRVPGSTDRAVLAAVNDGSLVRMHLLRPTWHLAAAEDARWLLDLTAPQIRTRLAYRDRQLELTEALYVRCNRLLERALRDGVHLSRPEIVQRLKAAGIPVDENRSSHLLLRAELDGVISSGACRNTVPTYALLDERVPTGKPVAREEALARLALRYFQSRGPATVEDFAWWSGLSAGDARLAVESTRRSLDEEERGPLTFLAGALGPTRLPADRQGGAVHLLPAYDEFTISYADREAVLARVHVSTAISGNGIFYPTVVSGGLVVGLWKRLASGASTAVEARVFGRQSAAVRAGVARAVKRLADFWGTETTLSYRIARAGKKGQGA